MKPLSNKFGISTVAVGIGLLPLANNAFADDGWWVKAGPMMRMGMSLKITGSSYSQEQGAHAVSEALSQPNGIGAANAYADRVYDNGYVMGDSSGGGGIDPNTTWNWGYNANSSASQYNAAAGTLSFSSKGTPGYTSTFGSAFSQSDDNVMAPGVNLEFGRTLYKPKSGKWSVDLGIGVQAAWNLSTHLSGSTYGESIQRMDVTDVYNVAGISSTAFTDLGHHGTYAGPFDAATTPPYTIIPDQPSRRNSMAVDLGWNARNRINFDMDMGLYQLSLNPSVSYAITKRLTAHLVPQIALDIIDMSAHRSETFNQTQHGTTTTLQSWQNDSNTTDISFGLGGMVGLDWDVWHGWMVGAYGGYDWVTSETSLNVGPNNVTLNTSAWVVGVNFGKSF